MGMFEFYDYMLEECLDPCCMGTMDYFHRRYEARADYTLDEDVESERLKRDNRKEDDKKPQQPKLLAQDQYDAEVEQEKRDMMDMEKRIRRATIFGGYIPCGYERDF